MPTPEEIKKQIEADKAKQETPLDFSKAVDNVANVESHVLSFKGKPGMNPFIYIRDNVDPLRSAYDRGDRSKALFDKMMSLKKVEPIAPKREPKRGIGGERKV